MRRNSTSKFSRKFMPLAAALAMAAMGSTGVLAVDKDQVIKDRQAFMKQNDVDREAGKGFLDDKNDQAKAISGATALTETMKKIPSVFPPDTEGPSPDGKYGTKPEIWTNPKGFEAARSIA